MINPNLLSGGAWCSSEFFFFFCASTVPDSLGVHLRSTGHYQPIRSGVVFDRANEARVYNKLVSALVNGGVFFNRSRELLEQYSRENRGEDEKMHRVTNPQFKPFKNSSWFWFNTHSKGERGVTCPGSK